MQQWDAGPAPQAALAFRPATTPRWSGTLRACPYSAKKYWVTSLLYTEILDLQALYKAPLCKGGWLRGSADWRIVTLRGSRVTTQTGQSLRPLRVQLPLHKGAFAFTRRWHRSWRERGRWGRRRCSRARPCWASSNPRSSPPGRDSTFQKFHGTAGFPW